MSRPLLQYQAIKLYNTLSPLVPKYKHTLLPTGYIHFSEVE